MYEVKFLFLVSVAHSLAISHLFNVVHADQNPLSSLIEDDQLFGQLLLVIHGCRNAEPLPPFKPWPPDVAKSSSRQTQVHPESHSDSRSHGTESMEVEP